jgi:hypothetical protein
MINSSRYYDFNKTSIRADLGKAKDFELSFDYQDCEQAPNVLTNKTLTNFTQQIILHAQSVFRPLEAVIITIALFLVASGILVRKCVVGHLRISYRPV